MTTLDDDDTLADEVHLIARRIGGHYKSHVRWRWIELAQSDNIHVARFGERWFLFACDGLEPHEVHSFDAALVAWRIMS